MTEDIITRMYGLLDHHPESNAVTLFERECTADPQLRQTWYDFLVEQSLAENITDAWKKYILHIPELKEQFAFQQYVQSGIRTLRDTNMREEIRRVLPKRYIEGINTSGRGPRFIVFATSIAAVVLLCIGVLVSRIWIRGSVDNGEGVVPILMVEAFASEGVTEEMLVHGIPQRIPAKLSATGGIYPITSFAVDHATHRAKTGEQPQALLNATHAMRGIMRRQGEDFLVEASLVDLVKNQELWKELFTVEDNAKAFDDLQDQLSLKITHVLHVAVNVDAQTRLTMEVSKDLNAVNLFLAGERRWAERTEESLEEAIKLFQMALARDSTSTIIRGYLALAYAIARENDYGDSTYWQHALHEALRTLHMDPLNPESLVVLGDHAFHEEKNYAKAEDYLQRALRVQPGDAKIHQALAELYLRTGEIAVGKEHIQIARAIEPEHRVVRWVETLYLTASGLLEPARDAANDLMEMYPDYPNIRIFDWQYHLSRKEHALALRAIPPERSEEAKKYFRALVYLDMKDYAAMHALYPHEEERPASCVVLEHAQKEEWETVYTLLEELLKHEDLHLIAWFQIAGFEMFNKMKDNDEVHRILEKYGIKVNLIPKEIEPEI